MWRQPCGFESHTIFHLSHKGSTTCFAGGPPCDTCAPVSQSPAEEMASDTIKCRFESCLEHHTIYLVRPMHRTRSYGLRDAGWTPARDTNMILSSNGKDTGLLIREVWVQIPRGSPYDAEWQQRLARLAHTQKVVGSNPTSATRFASIVRSG